VIVDPEDYAEIIAQIKGDGITVEQRFAFAAKAFAHTAQYDSAISNYFQTIITPTDALPAILSVQLNQVQALRYGENPHQRAGLYAVNQQYAGFTDMSMHQGKPLSFNNLNDAHAAVACLRDFGAEPTCVIIKHANPCGIAQADTLQQAYDRAYACDPSSAFGGIIAVNQRVNESLAKRIVEQQFMEVMIAPAYDEKALAVFNTKPNIRVLEYPLSASEPSLILKCIEGGILVQDPDNARITANDVTCVTTRQPTAAEVQDLIFAWRVVKQVKSNAIVYAKNGQTLGIGAGQSSRVASSQIAVWKAAAAQLSLTHAAMASDAFFPFRDSIDAAHQAGISAIIQPGGSLRDEEVINAANEHGMTMVFTGIRHFNH
jgi:phosphoribosylaminoimidazolecarboxamide formyltransferase/IMP cyclohydrolase